jgi:hypothetical protein
VQNTLFPGILVHLVTFGLFVGKRFARTVPKGVLLKFVPKVQQVRPVNLQLPAQPRRTLSFGNPPQYQNYLAARVLRALKDRASENVGSPKTVQFKSREIY